MDALNILEGKGHENCLVNILVVMLSMNLSKEGHYGHCKLDCMMMIYSRKNLAI